MYLEPTIIFVDRLLPINNYAKKTQLCMTFVEKDFRCLFINPESHLYVCHVEELVKRGGGTFYGQFRGFSQSNFMARKKNILCLLPTIKVCQKNDLCR